MRFPSCPQIPVVLDCEITADVESPDGAVRKTERRCKLSVEAPYLLKKVSLYFFSSSANIFSTLKIDVTTCKQVNIIIPPYSILFVK